MNAAGRAKWVLAIICVVVLYSTSERSQRNLIHLASAGLATRPPWDVRGDAYNPANFSWPHAVIDQWKSARALLKINTITAEVGGSCRETRKLAAYLAGAPELIGLKSGTPYGGILSIPSRGVCTAIWQGRRLVYHRVYKERTKPSAKT